MKKRKTNRKPRIEKKIIHVTIPFDKLLAFIKKHEKPNESDERSFIVSWSDQMIALALTPDDVNLRDESSLENLLKNDEGELFFDATATADIFPHNEPLNNPSGYMGMDFKRIRKKALLIWDEISETVNGLPMSLTIVDDSKFLAYTTGPECSCEACIAIKQLQLDALMYKIPKKKFQKMAFELMEALGSCRNA